MRAPKSDPRPATVRFRGLDRTVSLTSFGAVLRAEGQPEITAHAASVVSNATGIARSLIAEWIDAGHLEGFALLGAYFAVPEHYGQYPVLFVD